MARFADQYVREDLKWAEDALEAWTPAVLATHELGLLRNEVQVILAAMTSPARKHTLTDRRQLQQGLAHLRRMRGFWEALLVPGTVLDTGEHKLPAAAVRQGVTFNVRDWTFARQRRAESHRVQFVTVARQKPPYHNRAANRIATYYTLDIQGVMAVRGR